MRGVLRGAVVARLVALQACENKAVLKVSSVEENALFAEMLKSVGCL